MKPKINFKFKKGIALLGLVAVATPTALSVVACDKDDGDDSNIPWSELEPTIEQKVYEEITKIEQFEFYARDAGGHIGQEESNRNILFNRLETIQNLDLEDITILSSKRISTGTLITAFGDKQQTQRIKIDYEIKYLNFAPVKIVATMEVVKEAQDKVVAVMNNTKADAYDLGIKADDHTVDVPYIHDKIVKKIRKKFALDVWTLSNFNEKWMSGIQVSGSTEDNFIWVEYWYNGHYCMTWIKLI